MNRIVLISGKAGSGKTTLAKHIERRLTSLQRMVSHMTFAGPLYEMHDYCLGILNSAGITTDKKDRVLLQLLGTEWGRNTISNNIWVDLTKHKIAKLDSRTIVIISDCRFENEFDAFPSALKIRLVCSEEIRKERAESWPKNNQHASEIGLDEYEKEEMFSVYFNTEKDSVEHCTSIIVSMLLKDLYL